MQPKAQALGEQRGQISPEGAKETAPERLTVSAKTA
jgi:hypothetical protein